MTMLKAQVRSFAFPYPVYRFIVKNRWSWKYLLIPILINLTLFFLFWFLLFDFVKVFVSGLEVLSSIPHIFTTIVSGLLLLITFLISIYIFFLLATLIASPFNGLLVEKMLVNSGILSQTTDSGIKRIVIEIFRAVQFESVKIFLIILIALAGFLIAFIPAIGLFLSTTLSFAGNSYLTLADFFDPVLSYKGMPVSRRFLYVKRSLSDNFGLFLVSGLFMYVPIINIFYIPIGVIAATLSYIAITDKMSK